MAVGTTKKVNSYTILKYMIIIIFLMIVIKFNKAISKKLAPLRKIIFCPILFGLFRYYIGTCWHCGGVADKRT